MSQTYKHSTGKHNLFLQISGSRKFYLFQPTDLEPPGRFQLRVDAAIRRLSGPHISRSMTFLHSVEGPEEIQLRYIRASEFPSLANAWLNRLEITLTAGSALFIPAKMWHCTRILETGVALNWWFATECSSSASFPARRLVESLANDNWIEPTGNHGDTRQHLFSTGSSCAQPAASVQGGCARLSRRVSRWHRTVAGGLGAGSTRMCRRALCGFDGGCTGDPGSWRPGAHRTWLVRQAVRTKTLSSVVP